MQGSDIEAWGTHQYYQQNVTQYSSSLDALSGNSNNTTTAAAAAGKPIRRRSRASKRTPTTLVNANANNFRALVQKFTGNHTAHPPVSSPYKGPINLSFAASSSHPKNSDDDPGIDRQERHHQSLFPFAPSTHEPDPDPDPTLFTSPTVPVQVRVPMTTLTPEDFQQSGPGDYNNSINAARNDDFCWLGSAGEYI